MLKNLMLNIEHNKLIEKNKPNLDKQNLYPLISSLLGNNSSKSTWWVIIVGYFIKKTHRVEKEALKILFINILLDNYVYS